MAIKNKKLAMPFLFRYQEIIMKCILLHKILIIILYSIFANMIIYIKRIIAKK